jgi:nucleosome binding factor SPN SPT16 subunit
MAEIKIDSKLFQERISHFINAWKADKRSGDALFGGVSSILINMGKAEEVPEFHKNNAVHVSCCPVITVTFIFGADCICSSGFSATNSRPH